jgi:hypothetical protein
LAGQPLNVLGGKSAVLAASDAPLAGEVPEGAVVVASVTGLTEAQVRFKSPIINQSELFWVALGERDGEMFGQLKFVAKSDEAPSRSKTLSEASAMALLQHGSDEEAKKIIERLTVTMSQRTVQVEWRGAAEGVWKLIEQELK